MRILLTLIAAFAAALAAPVGARAQIDWKAAIDQTSAAKGANVFLQTDKAILEPGEMTVIRIHAMIDRTSSGDDSPPREDVVLIDGANPLYSAGRWKVDSGGGNIITVDPFVATYTAPKPRSASKFAVVSVELAPKIPQLPRVVLKTKVYLDENATAFVLTIPDYGWTNMKFVHALDNGTAMPDVSKYASSKLPPEARRKLEEAQRQMADLNEAGRLQKLSSNGFALHNEDDGFNAVKLRGLRIAANADDRVEMTAGDIFLEFRIFGLLDEGGFELGTKDSEGGLGMLVGGIGVGCGDMGPSEGRYRCDGRVTIEKVDEKYVYGTMFATVWSSKPGDAHVHRGKLYGKFKVWKIA